MAALDAIVARYLQKRGLQKAFSALTEELNIKDLGAGSVDLEDIVKSHLSSEVLEEEKPDAAKTNGIAEASAQKPKKKGKKGKAEYEVPVVEDAGIKEVTEPKKVSEEEKPEAAKTNGIAEASAQKPKKKGKKGKAENAEEEVPVVEDAPTKEVTELKKKQKKRKADEETKVEQTEAEEVKNSEVEVPPAPEKPNAEEPKKKKSKKSTAKSTGEQDQMVVDAKPMETKPESAEADAVQPAGTESTKKKKKKAKAEAKEIGSADVEGEADPKTPGAEVKPEAVLATDVPAAEAGQETAKKKKQKKRAAKGEEKVDAKEEEQTKGKEAVDKTPKVESAANGPETGKKKSKKGADKAEVKEKEEPEGAQETPAKQTEEAEGAEKSSQKRKRKNKNGDEKVGSGTPFKRVDAEKVELEDPRLADNSYWAKDGAETGWGAKAQEVLGQVKGKGFRHEKTKKKRGSYKGGPIDLQSRSIKFQNESDEE